MLTGRESLVRLIGRRRRSPLPALLAAALSPSPRTPAASAAQGDDGGASGEAAGAEAGPSSGGSGGVEWVSCPVCGESIRGSDHCVNTHLDICLARGTKRKLTQSTLLNFRFSKKASAEPANNLTNEVDTESAKQIDKDLSRDQAFFSLDSDIGRSKAGSTISSSGCLNGTSLGISKAITTYVPSSTVLLNGKDAVNNVLVEHCPSSMLPSVATSCNIDTSTDMDSSTIVAVDTVIVGRRFHENIELREDAGITFVRDRRNAKDSDAIKVLYAASECEEMLGYLPRELAKVLAPLMDKHYVECEGYVVGLPEQQLGNVPIQITIQKCKTDNQRNGDPKYWQSLWEKFISTVKSGIFQRPSSARYQTNFNLMIADVMVNHTHVFSDVEKSFLASFKSLSDDAQRLFVRIYTRNGPWFRKSTISYREISDLEHAAIELKSAGYIDMFSCTDDPSEYDMKEIIDVLTVPEMKEILKELPKVFNLVLNTFTRHPLVDLMLLLLSFDILFV